MSHKVVKVEQGSHYTGTMVPFDRSIVQIQAMLEKHKCSQIIVHKDMRENLPTTTILFEKAGLRYIIEFPVIFEKQKRNSDKLRMDVSGRIIHDRIKSLLIEVELNILDFSQGMMAFLLVTDQNGKPEALQDYVVEHREGLARGTFNLQYRLTDGT